MDLWGTLIVLWRRWYVAVPVLIASMGATLGVYFAVPTHYTSSSVLMLATPVTGGTVSLRPAGVSRTNPLLNFSSGMRITATMLVEALNTPDLATETAARMGKGTSVEVLNGAGNTEMLDTGPYLLVAGESTTRAKAKYVVEDTVALAREQLRSLQQTVGAPASTYITLIDVVAPTEAVPEHTGKLRAGVAALALGSVLSVLSAFAAESIAIGRRRPSKASYQPASDFVDDLARYNLVEPTLNPAGHRP